jgi:hypothetical protein
MANQNINVVVHDPHSISLYDVDSGQYLGIIYVTSGSIVGSPIISQKTVSVTSSEGGVMYMSTYDMTTRAFVRKIRV